jgi:hypothetical protein
MEANVQTKESITMTREDYALRQYCVHMDFQCYLIGLQEGWAYQDYTPTEEEILEEGESRWDS